MCTLCVECKQASGNSITDACQNNTEDIPHLTKLRLICIFSLERDSRDLGKMDIPRLVTDAI